MRLVFDRLEIHNFWSFKDEIFDFSKDQGITLIYGLNRDMPDPTAANGAGKSAIWSALTYGLFGRLASKINTDCIINRLADDKEMRVAVYLTADSQQYKAVSGTKRKNNSYFSLYKLQPDGSEEDITLSTIQETRDFFEKQVLGCDISLFLRTILLTSDQEYNFYMLKKAAKKEFIEKLFDIGVFGEMYDLIHKDILSYDKQLIAHQNQLVVLTNQQEECQKNIDSYNESRLAKIEACKKSIAELEKQHAEKEAEVQTQQDEMIKKCKAAKEKLAKMKDVLVESYQQLAVDISNIKSATDSANAKIKIHEAMINKHAELLSKLCDDCKPVFSKYYSLDVAKAEIAKLKDNIAIVGEKLKAKQAKQVEVKEKLVKLNEKAAEIDSKRDAAQEQIEAHSREVNEILVKLGRAKKDKADLEDSATPYDSMMKSVKEKIDASCKTLEKLTEEYKYLKCSEEIVSQDTLRKFIIKDLIVLINNRIKYYLTKMGSKYSVVFDVDMNYEFITESGKCDYWNFSCGERSRIRLATAFAFRDFMAARNNLSANILVLDEYLDHGLDTMALESILRLFKDFVRETHQKIYVVSHRAEVKNDAYNHYIRVEKKDGISHIISADE